MINILDSSVYNMISAGEVVENPASIVKELVENSIDAGATSVEIYITDGGINTIEIIDDGSGIPKDELFKAILPHATSKICAAEDLSSIATLGFRGEALASICAVSDFTIASKYFQADTGAILHTKGGQNYTLNDYSITNGTTITINSLFYNTPARFKFLKSKKSEENLVTNIVLQQILANSYIKFKYYVDNKLVYNASGEGLLSAITAIYSEETAQKLICLEDNNDKRIRITGYISPANLYKNTRAFQTVIINGRIVTDLTVSMTVQNAYAERLMHRCFPIFILNIVMPFDEIDVNVHPNKKEVRFANSRQVYGAIYQKVKDSLEETEVQIAKLVINDTHIPNAATESSDAKDVDLQNTSIKEGISSQQSQKMTFLDYMNISTMAKKTSSIAENDGIILGDIGATQSQNDKKRNDYSQYVVSAPNNNEKTSITTTQFIDNNSCDYRIIGQLFDTYLIIEYNDKMLLLDQHAVRERLLYDDLKEEFDKNSIKVQPLLIPYIYSGSAADINNLLAIANEVGKIGFTIEEFGNNSIKISTVPLVVTDINLDKFISDLLAQSNNKYTLSGIIRDKLMSMACKAAIKGGDKLSNEQITLTMQYFINNSLPLRCPHGRPTYIEFSKTDLEKLFRRKV